MSEYQYYEFQAIDRPLDTADREALRALSTRARITSTSFTNSYDWGDFKGDPTKLMQRWFDLHLYLANWGTRRLMIRLPSRLIARQRLDPFLDKVACAELKASGENLILDIVCEDLEADDDWDDGSGWLAELAPLRADLLGGDLRLLYLLWLTAVAIDAVASDEAEPLSGIGPITPALEAFAQFFGIDADLVAAAAERPAGTIWAEPPSSTTLRDAVAALPDSDKVGLLTRLAEGDPHVMSELRALIRDRVASETSAPPARRRTVAELRARAAAIRHAFEQAEGERMAAEQKEREEEEVRSQRARLDAVARRGERVWREIETEIERRNPSSYDRAAGLLVDLRTIAEERGAAVDFERRLRAIRERHARKERFIQRLKTLE